ncbi:MAG: T9SS type A sorting domain-containing protein [Flavobacteriales bacterium]|nr:T9SS type A sorting domain-containing protein [Flavobacteriales bacterium]
MEIILKPRWQPLLLDMALNFNITSHMVSIRWIVTTIMLTVAQISFAQLNLTLENIYFPDTNIYKVRVTELGEVIVITGINQNEAFIINENDDIISLQPNLSYWGGDTLTSCTIISDTLAFLGTKNNYLLKIQNDTIIQLNEPNGILHPHINSVSLSNIPYSTLVITSPDTILESNDLVSFTRNSQLPDGGDFEIYGNYSSGMLFGFSNYNNDICQISNSSVMARGQYYYGSGWLGKMYDDSLSIKINTCKLLPYSTTSTYSAVALSATNNGLHKRNIYFNSCAFTSSLEGHNVTSLSFFPSDNTLYSNEEKYLFAGTDNGLFYADSVSRNSLDNFSLLAITNNLSINDIVTSTCSTTLWCATDSGLYKYSISGWTRNSISPISQWDTLHYMCTGDSIQLNGMYNDDYNYQWIRNDTILTDETNVFTYATQPGVYKKVYSDCHATDTISTTILWSNIPNISFASSDTLTKCRGGYQSFNLVNSTPEFQASINWYLNNELVNSTSSFFPEKSGYYKCEIISCSGFSQFLNDSIYAQIDTVETPKFLFSGDLACFGDTIFLEDTENTVNIDWSYSYPQVGNFPFLVVKTLSYNNIPKKVTYQNDLGCSAFSNTPIFEISEVPEYTTTSRYDSYCYGDSMLAYVYNLGSNSFIWKDGYAEDRRYLKDSIPVYFEVSNESCTLKSYFSMNFSNGEKLLLNEFDTIVRPGQETLISIASGYDDIMWQQVDGGYPDKPNTNKDYYFIEIAEGTYPINIYIEDGKCEYNYEIEIRVTDSQEDRLTLYPNPIINSILYIRLIDASINLDLNIYDLNGNLVFTDQQTENIKSEFYQFNLSSLSSGMYYVNVISDHLSETIKVVLLNQDPYEK